MIKNDVTYRQQGGFAMPASGPASWPASGFAFGPASWTVSGRDFTVRALPVMGGVSAAATGLRLVDDVCVLGDDFADAAVVTDATPGPSAWSPPI